MKGEQEPLMPDPLPAIHASSLLPYADPDVARVDRITAILPPASITIALLGFPLGAFTSIILDARQIVSSVLAERGGFMVFAVLEGVAAACGLVGALRARGKNRRVYWAGVVGTVLGVIGSGIVLFMIAIGAIR
jgi:hypothetical protein